MRQHIVFLVRRTALPHTENPSSGATEFRAEGGLVDGQLTEGPAVQSRNKQYLNQNNNLCQQRTSTGGKEKQKQRKRSFILCKVLELMLTLSVDMRRLFLDFEPEVRRQPPKVYPCGVLRWLLQCRVPTARRGKPVPEFLAVGQAPAAAIWGLRKGGVRRKRQYRLEMSVKQEVYSL